MVFEAIRPHRIISHNDQSFYAAHLDQICSSVQSLPDRPTTSQDITGLAMCIRLMNYQWCDEPTPYGY